MSYPLNDESDVRNNYCISESEPRRHQVVEGMMVLSLVHVLEEVGVHLVGIDARKRDDEVRREPALGLDRNHGRQFALDVFKDGERNHALKRVEFVANDDALFDKAETVERRLFCGMKRECRRGDDDESREQVIPEKDGRYRAGDGDDAERPVPVGTFRVVVVFSPFPF